MWQNPRDSGNDVWWCDGGRQDIKYYIFPFRRFWYIEIYIVYCNIILRPYFFYDKCRMDLGKKPRYVAWCYVRLTNTDNAVWSGYWSFTQLVIHFLYWLTDGVNSCFVSSCCYLRPGGKQNRSSCLCSADSDTTRHMSWKSRLLPLKCHYVHHINEVLV